MNGGRLGAIALALACASCAGVRLARSWPVMGTYATAEAASRDAGEAERAVAIVRAELDRVDATMSNWRPDSELARLNREAAEAPFRVEDPGLASCLERALDAARRTGGAFDPTVGPLMTAWGFRPRSPRVPDDAAIGAALARVGAAKVRLDPAARTVRFRVPGMEIDLGGIAKGCALDDARSAVRAAGLSRVRSVAMDLGGAIALLGPPRSGRLVLGIADPDPAAGRAPVARLTIGAGAAVATSSSSENRFTSGGKTYGHIMDPRTGRPADSDVVEATAVDASATVTDVLSTALYVAGSANAAAILRAYPTAEAVLVVRDRAGLALVASASLEGRLEILPAARRRFSADSPRFTLPAATMDDHGRLRTGGHP